MSNCSEILQKGVFDQYHYSNKSEYHSKLKTIFSYSYDQLKTLDTQNDSSLKLLVDKFINLKADSDSSRKEYESIKERFLNTASQELDEKLAVEINTSIASSVIVEAWKECIKVKYGNSSNLFVTPNENSIGSFQNPVQDFLIIFRYLPHDNNDPEYLKINGLSIAGPAEFINDSAAQTIKPGDRVIRFGEVVQKARRTGVGPISIQIALEGRNVPIVEIPAIPDNSPPIPANYPLRMPLELIGSGYWQLINGDTEMDTDPGDIVPVTFSSALNHNEQEVWVNFAYKQTEKGGDKTTYEGSHTVILYKMGDPRFKIKSLSYEGNAYEEVKTETVGRNHQFNSFKINNSYLKYFEFRVDGPDRRDNENIGIRGEVHLDIIFDRR